MNKKAIINGLLLLVVPVLALVIFNYRYHIHYFFVRYFTPKTSKQKNDDIIKNLHPIFAIRIARFVKKLEQLGYDVQINSGYRSFEKQAIVNPSVLVSYHNFGGAVDMNVSGMGNSTSKSNWQEVGNIGQNEFGLRWGGNFSNYDPIHFDFGNEYQTNTLKTMLDNNDSVQHKYPKL